MPCPECGKKVYNSIYDDAFCDKCTSGHFRQNFKNWTSGDTNIDKLIQDSQLDAKYNYQLIEWIEYSNLEIIEHVADGGFGSVYKAVWKGGKIEYDLSKAWDMKKSEWNRDGDTEVAIKKFRNATNVTTEYLNEVNNLNNFFKIQIMFILINFKILQIKFNLECN